MLGRGGMGVVAAAFHLELEQRVALKLMLPEASAHPLAVARFLREARAAAVVTSEHVARVFDTGKLASGEPYIVMEYLEGCDLARVLETDGPFSAEQAAVYLLQACEALAEAHAAGIVHRDLKPSNLFLARGVDGERSIKVLDFGISKIMAPTHAALPMTGTSALVGSPLYMSPEQMASSKTVDARSDVWSLGVVLYELLAGTPPLLAESMPLVCTMVMTAPPPPIAERVPQVSALVVEVIERCLEDPERRYRSVGQPRRTRATRETTPTAAA